MKDYIVVELDTLILNQILIHCVFREDESPVHGLSETIVGVLGGGQLGRMLCQAASQMAVKVMVLDPQENCPASALSYHHMVGSFDDSATVEEFAKRFKILQIGSHLFSHFVTLLSIWNDMFMC